MKDQLKCSNCGKHYTPTGEERKLAESGDLAMTFCNDCCTVKDESVNYTVDAEK